MKKPISFIILTISLVFLTACNLTSKNEDEKVILEDKSDLTVCGDFPVFSGDGDAGAKYQVCRNTETGECFYNKGYSEQIDGCDPEFDPDTNPYGNNECFEWLNDIYNSDGNLTEKGLKALNENLKCQTTYQDYFESKVQE